MLKKCKRNRQQLYIHAVTILDHLNHLTIRELMRKWLVLLVVLVGCSSKESIPNVKRVFVRDINRYSVMTEDEKTKTVTHIDIGYATVVSDAQYGMWVE